MQPQPLTLTLTLALIKPNSYLKPQTHFCDVRIKINILTLLVCSYK